ncbi:MAG: rod shape-determining protein MreD [Elusimicrobiota bacterium]|nr:rod shape-determining protein MreD [Elusimicrobiota bacterium]
MKLLLTFIAGFIVQTFLYRRTHFFINIDIMLILTLEVSLIRGSRKGEFFGFFAGLAEDILFIGLLGEKALIRTLGGYLAGKFRGRFNEGDFIFQFIITSLIYAASIYAGILIRLIVGAPATYPHSIILSAALNGAAAYFVYHILRKIDAV